MLKMLQLQRFLGALQGALVRVSSSLSNIHRPYVTMSKNIQRFPNQNLAGEESMQRRDPQSAISDPQRPKDSNEWTRKDF